MASVSGVDLSTNYGVLFVIQVCMGTGIGTRVCVICVSFCESVSVCRGSYLCSGFIFPVTSTLIQNSVQHSEIVR